MGNGAWPNVEATTQMATSDDFAYDVFISYSAQDKAWVRGELLPRLEQAGLAVCIDFRDFRPGAPSVTEMERGVLTARRTLLVLTPAYLTSAWTEFETLLLQTLDPANRTLRLIPLRKELCDLPLRIRYLTYVDFADPDDLAIAWRQLLTALGAAPEQPTPAVATPATWLLAHPYAMPPNFTGRAAERTLLNGWLASDAAHPLLVLRALGGFGKSALTWHWLTHDVDARRWPRVVWWSFYESDASFEAFLSRTLEYLNIDPRRYGPRQQADRLLQVLAQPGTLLILDGFERQLRAFSGLGAAYQGDEEQTLSRKDAETQRKAFSSESLSTPMRQSSSERDCISPLAEAFLRSVAVLPGMQGKVLLTTRLRPTALEQHGSLLIGCREEELRQLSPADAVAFFRAQGIRGGRSEIETACAAYGCHPLSLRLLAGLVATDLQQPGDIAAARRLDVSGDLVQRQHHVLEHAYSSLTPPRQALLSRIACFRSAVEYAALHALAEAGDDFDTDLRDLVERGLLHREADGRRFDLHPIVRRYAYDRLTGAAAHTAHARLRDYFAAAPAPDKPQRLEELLPVIELYHHTVRAGQYDEAMHLLRDRLVPNPLHFQFGTYQLMIDLKRALFPDGEERPPRLRDERDQAWTLNALAASYSLSGQPRRAVPLFEQHNAIREKQGDKVNLAIGLGNLASMAQIHIGALHAAAANLRRRIDLCREIEDAFNEAIGHQDLGRLLAYTGAWAAAEAELAAALEMFEKEGAVQSQGVTWAYRALRSLLLARADLTPNPSPARRGSGQGHEGTAALAAEALAAARRALELADEWARTEYPVERDYVRAHWLLGAAHRLAGDLAAAERHLDEALTRCRAINLVDHEADILLDLARLRAGQRAAAADPAALTAEALRLAEEALIITERSGYVLQGADVQLFLAQMAQEAGDLVAMSTHAAAARRLAACDGPPDYTYKVAYDEAGRMLGIGE